MSDYLTAVRDGQPLSAKAEALSVNYANIFYRTVVILIRGGLVAGTFFAVGGFGEVAVATVGGDPTTIASVVGPAMLLGFIIALATWVRALFSIFSKG
jgi:hypothetical protein